MTRVLRTISRPVVGCLSHLAAHMEDASQHWAVGLGCDR